MTLDSAYLLIKTAHMTAAFASGLLFLARGLGLNAFGARWPMTRGVRYLSWTIDTVLLAGAVSLMTIIRQLPGADAWLTVKVALVLLYIGLGYFALGRARSRRASTGLWLLALLVFAGIYGVARTHSPLGWVAAL